MEPDAGLLDVPPDLLRHILALLSHTDIVALSSTCRALHAACSHDVVWQAQCAALLRKLGAELGLEQLQQRLGLSSARSVFKLLHRLGLAWPCGLWAAAEDSGQGPRGRMVLVSVGDGGLRLQTVDCRAEMLGVLPATVPMRCEELVRLRVRPSDADVSLVASACAAGAPPVLALALSRGGGSRLTLLHGPRSISLLAVTEQHHIVPFVEEERSPRSSGSGAGGSAPTSPRWTGRLFRLAASDPPELTFSRVVLPPLEPGLQGEAPGLSLLSRLQGLWTGVYSAHGWEVLRVTVENSGAPAPPDCAIAGPRLEGLKLLGDPNVPASKHSFVADAASCRLGPYRPEDDPFPVGGAARPILSFLGGGAAVMVSMAPRPVAARFRAVGQINRIPGVWLPEWEAATLVVYAPLSAAAAAPSSPEARRPGFTVIFEDEGEPFRHAMDFFAFPLQPPGSALRRGPGGGAWAAAWLKAVAGGGDGRAEGEGSG